MTTINPNNFVIFLALDVHIVEDVFKAVFTMLSQSQLIRLSLTAVESETEFHLKRLSKMMNIFQQEVKILYITRFLTNPKSKSDLGFSLETHFPTTPPTRESR